MKLRNAWAAIGWGGSLKMTHVSIQYSVPSDGMMYFVSGGLRILDQLVEPAGPGQAEHGLLGLELLLVLVGVEREDVRGEGQQQVARPSRARVGSTELRL